MRRLDPDVVYGEVLGQITGSVEPSPVLPGQPDEVSETTGVADAE